MVRACDWNSQDPGFDSRRGCAVFFSSDPAVSSSIFVGAEREPPDKSEFTIDGECSSSTDLKIITIFRYVKRCAIFLSNTCGLWCHR